MMVLAWKSLFPRRSRLRILGLLSVWDFYRLNDACSSLKKGLFLDSNRDLNKNLTHVNMLNCSWKQLCCMAFNFAMHPLH